MTDTTNTTDTTSTDDRNCQASNSACQVVHIHGPVNIEQISICGTGGCAGDKGTQGGDGTPAEDPQKCNCECNEGEGYIPPENPSTEFFSAITTPTPGLVNGYSTLLVDEDENIVLAGDTTSASDKSVDIYKLAPDGNVLNSTRINFPQSTPTIHYTGLAQGAENSYLLAVEYNTALYLFQLDSDLTMIQQAHFALDGQALFVKGCAATSTGELIVATDTSVTANGTHIKQPVLFKFDTQFNMVASKTLEGDRNIKVEGLDAVGEDTFIVRCMDRVSQRHYSMVLLKFDGSLDLQAVSEFNCSDGAGDPIVPHPQSIIADDRGGYLFMLVPPKATQGGIIARLDADMALLEKIDKPLPLLDRERSQLLALNTGGYIISGTKGIAKHDPELNYENNLHYGHLYPRQLDQDSRGRLLIAGRRAAKTGALVAVPDTLDLSRNLRINSTTFHHEVLSVTTNLVQLENIETHVVITDETITNHTDPALQTSSPDYGQLIEPLID